MSRIGIVLRLCVFSSFLAVVSAVTLASPVEPGWSASTSLCGTAEAHQARWQNAHRKLLGTWAQGNYERAALVAGAMSGIAREALSDARSAPARTRSARAFRSRIVAVHEGQRSAAALFVDAMIAGGAGRMGAAGRAYAQANITLLRAGFVGDYC